MSRDGGHERLRDHLISLSISLPALIERVPGAGVDGELEAQRLAGFAAYLTHYGDHDGQSGGGTLGPLDVREVLSHAVRLTRGELQQKARVNENYLAAPPVRASLRQLGQVFISLLINAAQATPAGDPDAHTIAVELDTSDDGWARIAIADTGAGIAADVLPRIFEPLFSTKRGEGMGIGLALVRALIEDLGGRISVESEPGFGTLFILELPPAP